MPKRDEKCIQLSVGKPERKRPLATFRCIRENDIKMYLKETNYENMD
jgi:hypothetical protein